MTFNTAKCNVIHARDKNPKFDNVWGERTFWDVGMIVTSNLKPSAQAVNAARIANLVLGQLGRGVTCRYRATFIRLYKLLFSLICAMQLLLGDKEVLEKVQKRAVMMVTNLRGSYENT